MAWPTKIISIEDYEGWEVEIYDLTVGEIENMESSVTDQSIPSMVRALLPAVKGWNFTSREGASVEVSEEGIKQLPMPVMQKLLYQILERMNDLPIPKETSTTES